VYGGASLDPFFARLEERIFGMQPAVEFAEALGYAPGLTELFFFGYFFYYLLITSGFWLMFLRGRQDRAARCVFIVSTSFAVLYVWYVFFPVHGPKYFIDILHARYYAEFDGFLFTSIMTGVLPNMNLAGAAFPSSHVAIALVALFLNKRYAPRLAAVYAPMTLLLMVSTVYIYAHYAVDVLAGVLVGPLLYVLVRRFYPAAVRAAGAVDGMSRPSRL
jgi:membrane-associated phospholipid phosphatase